MPFKSKAQFRLLMSKRPDIAKRWLKEGFTPVGLPEHVKKRKKSKYMAALSGK